ncbi:MAG TPA: menaquinone-dependent protoporphyrinogen IX dehydrogenase [Gammaproteobacteria bacterium]|jgi:menaquinone-dependent protoporphyrinogen oxidase|nr:menaquinone-dependent protoporphyrinogen IX dehydrogenase [Gammaproteobacteria bacterium]
MAKVLILYSTVDGHTHKICQHIRQEIESSDTENSVELALLDVSTSVDLAGFDKIVIGASIRYGKHRPAVFAFIREHLTVLSSKPSAFFTVNLVARKPEKNQPDTNPYMRKFLTLTDWRPRELAVFAGKVNYALYGPLDRTMIRFIMWITKGPTDPTTNEEFTSWDDVAAFSRRVLAM